MPRLLAIDYGHKRIGLALSDENQQFAFELGIYSPEEFFKKIFALVTEKEISKLILGYPLNMSGQETKITEEVKAFKIKLENLLPNLIVETIDERLSSQMAQKLAGTGKNIDSLAAQIFLQNYLNKNAKNIQTSQKDNTP